MGMQAQTVADALNVPAAVRAIANTPTEFAAEVTGVDLAQAISAEVFARVLELFNHHAVLCFRRQILTPAALAAFAARFGKLEIHHMTQHVLTDLPQVRILSNIRKNGQAVGVSNAGMHWHSDLSYKPVPALATLLYGVECPPTGANTEFVSMSAAYTALPASLRKKLHGMRALHDRNFRYSLLYPERSPLTPEQVAGVPPVEHPVVRIHPATGQPALFVAKDIVSTIVGMPQEDSRQLLDQLERAATQPDLIYAHRWQPGDLLVWDNRCTLHRATPFDNQHRRFLYRAQVEGEVPVAA